MLKIPALRVRRDMLRRNAERAGRVSPAALAGDVYALIFDQ